jgi:hypothetical protein
METLCYFRLNFSSFKRNNLNILAKFHNYLTKFPAFGKAGMRFSVLRRNPQIQTLATSYLIFFISRLINI